MLLVLVQEYQTRANLSMALKCYAQCTDTGDDSGNSGNRTGGDRQRQKRIDSRFQDSRFPDSQYLARHVGRHSLDLLIDWESRLLFQAGRFDTTGNLGIYEPSISCRHNHLEPRYGYGSGISMNPSPGESRGCGFPDSKSKIHANK